MENRQNLLKDLSKINSSFYSSLTKNLSPKIVDAYNCEMKCYSKANRSIEEADECAQKCRAKIDGSRKGVLSGFHKSIVRTM